MSAYGMVVTVLATQLAEAVAKDETPEEGGCDLSAGMFGPHVSAWLRGLAATAVGAPIDMILHCPRCHLQHVDAPANEEEICIEAAERGFTYGSRDWEAFVESREWTNPPHRSHLCAGCGYIWRPADVPTNGVAEIKTKGEKDTGPVVVEGDRPVLLFDRIEVRIQEGVASCGLYSGSKWLLTLDPVPVAEGQVLNLRGIEGKMQLRMA